ncbi:MAG TPA: retropepsin-like aspartic protease [Blastocatellia bacterium]|nr:retropepsin-like aspartic protease [Blastocatellia bacterium]
MKSYTLPGSWIVQLVVCGLLLVASGSGQAATKLRFRLAQDYLVVVPVTINGAGPFDFILDTGTTTTIVDSKLAADLRLQAADRLNLVTLAGEKPFPRSWLQSASVGEATTTHLEVVWDDLKEIKAFDKKIRGILGLNFLDGFNYLINYAARTIEIGDTSSRISGPRIAVDRTEGKLIITATAGSTPTRSNATRPNATFPLRFGLDSGVTVPVIYTPDSRHVCVRSAGLDSPVGIASTITGTASTATGRIVALDIGGHRLSGLEAALMPKVDPESQIEDGVLPTALFRAIYFNNEQGYVVLNPGIANDSSPRNEGKAKASRPVN